MRAQRTYQLIAEELFKKLCAEFPSGKIYETRYLCHGLVKNVLLSPVRLANHEDSCLIFPKENTHISELIILDIMPPQFDRARGVFDYTRKQIQKPIELFKVSGGSKEGVLYINEPSVTLIKDVPYTERIFQKITRISNSIQTIIDQQFDDCKQSRYPYMDIPLLKQIRTQPEPTET